MNNSKTSDRASFLLNTARQQDLSGEWLGGGKGLAYIWVVVEASVADGVAFSLCCTGKTSGGPPLDGTGRRFSVSFVCGAFFW